MCGIVGFVKNGDSGKLKVKLNSCLELIRHRGPDYSGTFQKDSIYLGHAQLKIIDQSNDSNQPFESEDNRFAITYNGELYNYLEIKTELQNQGFSFRTKSDTEVILQAYRFWGRACVEHFSGMFAFSIFDAEQQTLFLARDIFGEKPLYYSTKDGFAFSSELNPFKLLLPELKISLQAVNHFLAIGYVLNPLTLYEDVFMLEPASTLLYSIETGYLEQRQYFDYAHRFEQKVNLPVEEIIENVQVLLEKSVKQRITGNFPFGVFLSGGLDSSTIACLLKQHENSFPCFNIAFSRSKYDENPKAAFISHFLDLALESADLSDIQKPELDDFLRTIDYATFDNSGFPIYKLSQRAKQSVKYVLTGDGADEIFGGYPTYRADRIQQRIRSFIPLIHFSGIGRMVQFMTRNQNDKIGFQTKVNRFVKGLDQDYQKSHYNWRQVFSIAERIQLLGEENTELILESDPFHTFRKKYGKVKHLSKTDQHLFVDSQTWLTDNILIKMDRNSMLAGLETRSPFLDKALVSFLASCPPELKKDKFILKKAMEKLLPKSIVEQPKTGFNAPTGNWFNVKQDEFQFYTEYIYNLKYKP